MSSRTSLESLLEDEAIAARIAAVLPVPPGKDADTWRQTIVDAVDVDDDWLEGAFEEEMYGAFGIRLFSHYDFAIDASLPGTPVESNATSREWDRDSRRRTRHQPREAVTKRP